MYDAIIKDLTDAIAVLPVQSAALTRGIRAAAEALLGKVYLFMGRNSDALPLLRPPDGCRGLFHPCQAL